MYLNLFLSTWIYKFPQQFDLIAGIFGVGVTTQEHNYLFIEY